MTCSSSVDRRLFRVACLGFTGLLLAAGCSGSGDKKDSGHDAATGIEGGTDTAPLPAALGIAPTTFTFPQQVQLTTSQPASFTVNNSGQGPSGSLVATIVGAQMSEFTIATNTCTSSLPAGNSCSITVTFRPESAGMKTAALKVVGKGTEMAMATLQGTGVPPAAFTITPNLFDFGSPVVGQDSPAVEFTIKNAGGVDNSKPEVLVSGVDAAQFIMTKNDCALMLTLPVGMSCKVTLKFRPASEGQKGASLQVSATTGGTASASITGTGIAPGALSVMPTIQSFASVLIGKDSGAFEFTIANGGGAPVAALTTSISGADNSQFHITNSTCGATLAPNASCKVEVTFSPTGRGAKAAALNISGTPGSPVNASLSGTGLQDATLVLDRNIFTYSTTTVGDDTQPAVKFEVSNKGDVISGPLTASIGGTNKDDFVIVSSGCTTTLDVGAACSVDVRFIPKATGQRAGTLTVSGTPGGSVTANLNGQGKSVGALTISAPLDFGNVPVGSMSVAQTFIVTNTGGSPLGPLSTALGGANPTQFPITTGGNGCQNTTLQPSGTCMVSILFAPTSAGAKAASLTVSAGIVGSVIGGISGTGLNPAALSVNPTQKNFGSVATGQNSPTTTFTVTNTGQVTTGMISGVLDNSTDAADFGIVSTNCVTLAPAASCNVIARFSPRPNTQLGQKDAQITISATPGGLVNVPLSGLAVDPASLSVSPPSKDYSDIVVDSSSDQIFTLTNNGAGNTGTITTQIGGTDQAHFHITSTTCSQLIQQNATCTVTVRFTPETVGAKTASLQIRAATAGLAVDVPLTGNGLNKLTICKKGDAACPGGTTAPAVAFGTSFPAKKINGPTQVYTVTCTAGGQSCGPLVPNSDANGQFAVTTTCPAGAKIGQSSSCEVTVKFTPTVSGQNKQFNLTVTGGAKEAVSAAMSGGAVPPLTVSPTGQVFADTLVGTFRDSATFNVLYATDVPDTGILSSALAGANKDQFAITADTCAGVKLAAGDPCTFTVRFIPRTVESGLAANVTISGTPGESVTANVSGNGVASASISVSPGSDNLGSVFTGSTGSAHMFTVSNAPNTATSGVLSFGVGGLAGATVTGGTCMNAMTTLASGSNCTILVTFAPAPASNPGVRVGALGVSAAGNNTVFATLTATALSPISITPSPYDYGALSVGATPVSKTFTIKNESASAIVGSVSVTVSPAPGSASDPSFTRTNTPSCNALAAGATCTVDVTFDPGSGNSPASAAGSIDVTGTNISARVTLTGSRIGQSVLSIAPTNTREFGAVVKGGASAPESFTVLNSGGATTEVLTPAFTGGDTTQFAVVAGGTCTAGATKLATGQSCTFLVEFAPTTECPAAGVGAPPPSCARTTAFSVTAVGATGSNSVTLNGTKIPDTGLNISPTPHYFGAVVGGGADTSASVAFTVSVPAGGAATTGVPMVSISGDFEVAPAGNGCTAMVSANGSCTIQVRFRPQAEPVGSLVSGTLTVDGGAAGTATAALTGTVQKDATLVLNPGADQNFQEVVTGSTSSVRTITVRNSGDVPTDAAVVVTKAGTDPAHFALVSNGCTAVLQPNGTCTFGLQFAPTTSGSKAATISVAAGSATPVGFALSGNALSPTSLSITPDLSPAEIDFGTAAVGSDEASTDQTFTVKNLSGAVATTALAVTTSQADFSVDSGCPDVLVGGASCTVTVRLTPTSVNTYHATLAAVGGPGGTPVTVPIKGKGVSALTASPAGTFPPTAVGSNSEISFTIHYDTTAVGDTPPLPVTFTSGGNFSVVSDNCAGAILAPDDDCTIKVRFIPVSTGSKNGSIVVGPAGYPSQLTISLAGTGT